MGRDSKGDGGGGRANDIVKEGNAAAFAERLLLCVGKLYGSDCEYAGS